MHPSAVALRAIAIFCALFSAVAARADAPTGDELELLKTFRGEFVDITPGKGPSRSFEMGGDENSSQPSHRVTFDYKFAVARYEVPQNLWQAVMGSNPSRWKGPRNSAEMFSWDEAVAFCRTVTDRLRAAGLIEPNQLVRLPSEAEWEYVARAGTNTLYSFGDDVARLDDHAWSTRNAKGNDPPVGAKKPNAWDLYDVHGYLWEWCADAWHSNYDGAPADGSPWTAGGESDLRVLRGGSWKDQPELLTSSHRRGANRKTKDDAVGLRCVLAEEPAR